MIASVLPEMDPLSPYASAMTRADISDFILHNKSYIFSIKKPKTSKMTHEIWSEKFESP